MLMVLSTIDRVLGFTAVQGTGGRRDPVLVSVSVGLPTANPLGTALLMLVRETSRSP
jgi:hypothetical protein